MSKINKHTKFCMFIGYPRSGHSLVGSLLDAHPNIIISNELDVIAQMKKNISFKKLCRMIIKNSKHYAKNRRINTGYDLTVPTQFHGKYTELLIIGDKKGGRTNRYIMQEPYILNQLIDYIPIPIKFIHIIRNPYDNIATRCIRRNIEKKEDRQKIIENHFERFNNICDVAINFNIELRTLKHEDLIHDTERSLKNICSFLEVPASKKWIESCNQIIYKKPNKTRCSIDWQEDEIEKIQLYIDKYDLLKGYNFSS